MSHIKYCPECANKLKVITAGGMKVLTCKKCELYFPYEEEYHRINPNYIPQKKKQKKEDKKLIDKSIRKIINSRYTPSLWDKSLTILGIGISAMLFLFCFTLLVLNPISLAILCSTITIILIIVGLLSK